MTRPEMDPSEDTLQAHLGAILDEALPRSIAATETDVIDAVDMIVSTLTSSEDGGLRFLIMEALADAKLVRRFAFEANGVEVIEYIFHVYRKGAHENHSPL